MRSTRERTALLLLLATTAFLAVLAIRFGIGDTAESVGISDSGSRSEVGRSDVLSPDVAPPDRARQAVEVESAKEPAARPLVPTVVEHGEVSPRTHILLEGVPNVGGGSCAVRVVFTRESGGGAVVYQQVLAVREDGRVRIGDAAIRAAREGAGWYAVRWVHGAPSMLTRLVTSAGGASFAAIGAREEEVWRPEEPVVGICAVDDAGEILWDAALRLHDRTSPRRSAYEGCVPLFERHYRALDFLDLSLGGERAYVHVDLYPLGLDGLVRVPESEFGEWNRELHVVGDTALPASVDVRFECEVAGAFVRYEPRDGASRPRVTRTALGWEVDRLPPGVYRVVMRFGGLHSGGEVVAGVADLRLAPSATVRFDAPPVHRNLRVRLVLPDEVSPVGVRPWYLSLTPDALAGGWIPCHQGSATFHWMGPLPTRARLSGRRGPMTPVDAPIAWEEDGVGVLDLSSRRLRRATVTAADANGRIRVGEPDTIVLGERGVARERQWFVVELDGVPNLFWWEGAEFVLPASDASGRFDPIEARDIGERDVVELRRPGGEPVVVHLLVTEVRPRVFAWRRDREPSEEEARAMSNAEGAPASAHELRVAAPRGASTIPLSVPFGTRALVLVDPRDQRVAVVDAGAWGASGDRASIRVDALDWR